MGIIGILMGLLELRNIMVFNLILETTLTLLSPLRKTTSSSAVMLILWVAYTLSGLAVDYTTGLAGHASMGNITTTKAEESLIALWASFTSLYVGGPDSITAFSMEDTNSWFRSYIRLSLTICILLRTVTVLFPRNRLAVAIWSLYIAGYIKFTLRSLCVFYGNLKAFKTFTKPFAIGRAPVRPWLPTDSDGVDSLTAFEFFQTFKRVFGNIALTPQQYIPSYMHFLDSQPVDALELVETELNFAYDVFYTNTSVILMVGWITRWSVPFLELLAFAVWVSVDKHKFHKLDVRVTYTLFLSSLLFQLVSFFRVLLSDFSIASLLQRAREDGLTQRLKLVNKLISLKKKFPGNRWSKSVPRYSLVMCCTSKYSTKVEEMLDWFKIKDLVYNFKNMSPTRFDEKTRYSLFHALRHLAMHVDPEQAPKIRSWARGDWILKVCYPNDIPLLPAFIDSWFNTSIKFEKFVLLWHVATELCYYTYSSEGEDDIQKDMREFTKTISNYMAHVLLKDDTLLSEVAGEAKVTFQHTCDHVVKFLVDNQADMRGLKDEEKVERACKMIVMKDSEEEVDQLVDEYSVLEEARRLSKELKGLTENGIDVWEVMSLVWVELMCYAACNCTVSEHAAQLPKGGQLLTIVWFLVAHLGMSIRFQDLN